MKEDIRFDDIIGSEEPVVLTEGDRKAIREYRTKLVKRLKILEILRMLKNKTI